MPEHAHVNEQIGILLSRLAHLPDRRRGRRRSGRAPTWVIPAHVPHSVTAGPKARGWSSSSRRPATTGPTWSGSSRLGRRPRSASASVERHVPGSRRLSQRISEGDGIAIIVCVDDAGGARDAEAQGAKALAVYARDRRDPRGDHAAAALDRRRRRRATRTRSAIRPEDDHDARAPRGRRRRARRGGARARARAARPGDLPALADEIDEDADPLDAVLELLPDVPAGKLAIAQVDVGDPRRGAGARAGGDRRGARHRRASRRSRRPPARSTSRPLEATMAPVRGLLAVVPARWSPARCSRAAAARRKQAAAAAPDGQAEAALRLSRRLAEAREPDQGARLLPRLAARSADGPDRRQVEQHQLGLAGPQLPRELRLAGDRRRRRRR